MQDSKRTSRNRRRARRSPAVIFAVVFLALLAAWNYIVAPRFPANPRRTDLSGGALITTERGLGPFYSSEDLEHARILVIGDSRAHHGIVVDEFAKAGLGRAAVIWGSGAQLLQLLPELRSYPARRVVVSLSPLSIYAERNPEFDAVLATIQGMSPEKIDFLLNDWLDVHRRGATFVLGTKSWRRSWFYEANPSRNNATYRRRLRESTRLRRTAATTELRDMLRGLARDGWEFVCVRLPLSRQLLRIEERAYPSAFFDQLCSNLEVPFLDYSRSEYDTHDGTHLAADDSARFSADLASTLRDVMGW